jgi:hypothetical protein
MGVTVMGFAEDFGLSYLDDEFYAPLARILDKWTS